MHAHQLLEGRERRVVIHEIGIDPLGDQVIADGGKALRALRVMRTHVVQLAVAMGDEGCGRHLVSLCGPAPAGAFQNAIIVPIHALLQALEWLPSTFSGTS
jgi:hypothetical protein